MPGSYDDWLVCMFSTRIHQEVEGFDEVIAVDSSDFEQSGLKTPSVVRLGRLAVVSDDMLLGCIGMIGQERLARVRGRLADWIRGDE